MRITDQKLDNAVVHAADNGYPHLGNRLANLEAPVSQAVRRARSLAGPSERHPAAPH